MSENRKFKWDNDTKQSKDTHFAFFLKKKILTLKKNEQCFSIYYFKSRNTYQFYLFIFKNALKNVSEDGI